MAWIMILARMLPRAQLAARIVAFLTACTLFAWALYLAWLAFTNPLELEIREGSVWIHVLAKRAGVDIYDPSQVAFVNMNHGPLDPLLKTWISTVLPMLPGHMVTRVFVLLSPIFLFGAAYIISRKNLTGALFAAGALYLTLAHVSLLLLVGRTDATAICGLSICGILTHGLLVNSHHNWSGAYIAKQVGLGSVSSAVFLTSWRYLPVVAALQFVVLAKQLAESNARVRLPARPARVWARIGPPVTQATISTVLYAFGFASVWLPVFVFELQGNFETYYKRFFGFFSTNSGWGTFGGPEFQLLPDQLVQTRLGLLALVTALVVLGLYRLRRRRLQLVAWVLMLSSLWLTVSYGYFKNQLGGGLHYFFAFFLLAWIFVLHALCARTRRGPQIQLVLVCMVVFVLPWQTLLAQVELASEARARAWSFRRAVAVRTQGRPILGEGTHLFKTSYRGELVDSGDVAAALATSGYLGAEFSYAYQSYVRKLKQSPPRFVLAGVLNEATWSGIMTPALQLLLRRDYTQVLVAPGSSFTYGGSQVLFERKAGLLKAKQARH